jgi:hypothetical protein
LANKSAWQRADDVSEPGLFCIWRFDSWQVAWNVGFSQILGLCEIDLMDFQLSILVKPAPVAFYAYKRAKSHLPITMKFAAELLPAMVASDHEFTVRVFVDVAGALSVRTGAFAACR